MEDFKNSIKEYLDRERAMIEALDLDALNEAMKCMLAHYRNGDTIYVMGNGGSAATASHMVCDFNKGVSIDLEKKFNLVCVHDNMAQLMATANDIGYEETFVFPLRGHLKKSDLVIAISGSGNSKNVVRAVEYANQIGCDVIGVTGYNGGKLKNMSNYHVDANVNDMQLTEDMHMIFVHYTMQIMWKYLMAEAGKDAIYKINQ